MKKISCIICAYNEEGRIGNVLKAIYSHPLIEEIIVVDDGSKDGTARVVENYKNATLIKHAANKGKSEAFVTGISNASQEYIMMLDADLIGLTAGDITLLAEPVLSGKADASISLRKNSLFIYRWLGIDYVSGERVFKKNFLSGHLEKIKKLPGYGLESYMNELIIEKKMRIFSVKWNNVIHTKKTDKIGFLSGSLGELKMIFQIIRLVKFHNVLRQIWALARMAKANTR